VALTPNWNLINVVGTYVDMSGNAMSGTVTFTPNLSVVIAEDPVFKQLIVPLTVSATLDGTGHFSINLPASDDLDITPNGWTYTVVETFGGFTRTYSITVPVATVGALDLATVAPATSSSGMTSYTLLTTTNALALRVSNLEAAPASPDYARRFALLLSGI
jgi:hypothetical protein